MVSTNLATSPVAITVPAAAAEGTYNATVTISSSVGGTCERSYGIEITVYSPASSPVINTQPLSQSICSGNTAELSVAAVGSVTGYQWQSSSSFSCGV